MEEVLVKNQNKICEKKCEKHMSLNRKWQMHQFFGMEAWQFLCRDPIFSPKYHSIKMYHIFANFLFLFGSKKQIYICINSLGSRRYCLLFSDDFGIKIFCHNMLQI